MAYKEKDTKKWSAQWFETTAKGEKKKRRKRGFETKLHKSYSGRTKCRQRDFRKAIYE